MINHLFVGGKFADIVGEEDPSSGSVDIVNAPYRVDDLLVPVSFSQIIDDTRRSMDGLSEQIDTKIYQGNNSDDAYLKLHGYDHIYIII